MIHIHRLIEETLRPHAFQAALDLPRYRHSATLFKNGQVYLAQVVSHLSLADWAQMKGYEVSGPCVSTLARAEERTKLE